MPGAAEVVGINGRDETCDPTLPHKTREGWGTRGQACGALLGRVGIRFHGAAGEVWEDLKTDGFVESHPDVAKDATLGWGTRGQACGALLGRVGIRVQGAAGEVWEDLKTDGFVESHPNVAKDATLGWGTRPTLLWNHLTH